MEHGALRETVAQLYRSIEAGDRDGVAQIAASSLRVEGWMDGAWAIWDRPTYLDRVASFRALLGEAPTGTLSAVRSDGQHAIVDGTLSWSGGRFEDTLVLAHRAGRWRLQHKTFRFAPA